MSRCRNRDSGYLNSISFLAVWLIISLSTAACDPIVGYEYYIDNKSDKELSINLKGGDYNDSLEVKLQSPQTKGLIYSVEMWGKNPHDEKDDFLWTIDTLQISSSDSLSIRIDYLERDNWSYTNEIIYFGLIRTGTNIYTLKLENEDFSD